MTKLLKHQNTKRILKKLNGHSGCTVELSSTKTGTYVTKTSGSIAYNFRLKKQCKKQLLFAGNDNVTTPKIISCNYEKGLFTFDMEYIQGKTLAEYTENIKILEIAEFIQYLFNSLYISDQKFNPFANRIFKNKIYELENKLGNNQELIQAFELLHKFNWVKVYKSPCHGDLTLENILITKDKKLYLIDFLDSFYNSWMIDIAKILQDLELGWSFRNTAITSNRSLRLQIAKEALIEEILSKKDGEQNLKTIYHLLLLNILRIYPYTKDFTTLEFLNKSVEKVIKKIKE